MLLCVYVTEQGQARCSQDQFCGGSWHGPTSLDNCWWKKTLYMTDDWCRLCRHADPDVKEINSPPDLGVAFLPVVLISVVWWRWGTRTDPHRGRWKRTHTIHQTEPSNCFIKFKSI
jgi:hypothetical protein